MNKHYFSQLRATAKNKLLSINHLHCILWQFFILKMRSVFHNLTIHKYPSPCLKIHDFRKLETKFRRIFSNNQGRNM